jgi:exosortase K
MWVLKQHYSSAEADDLTWILTPVAIIVQAVDGLAYTWKGGIGWVRSDQFITIAKSCAGVNFLIMLFGLSTAAFLHRLKNWPLRMVWLLLALLGAYGITIGANSLRIMVAIIFYEHNWSFLWFTPDRLHRMIGVAVYFPVLGLYYLLLDRIMKKLDQCSRTGFSSAIHRPLLPLYWYIVGAVLVPWLHAVYGGKPWPNWEYCLTVVGGSTLLWLGGRVGWQLIKK